jgi:hypothetical protein
MQCKTLMQKVSNILGVSDPMVLLIQDQEDIEMVDDQEILIEEIL